MRVVRTRPDLDAKPFCDLLTYAWLPAFHKLHRGTFLKIKAMRHLMSVMILLPLAAHAQTTLHTSHVRAAIMREASSFLEHQRDDLYAPNVLITNALSDFLDGDEQAEVLKHSFLFQGCRHHSCQEKAAAILTRDKKALLGFALLNYQCRLVLSTESKFGEACSEQPRLNVYILRRSNLAPWLGSEIEAAADLQTWGAKFTPSQVNVRIIPHPKISKSVLK